MRKQASRLSRKVRVALGGVVIATACAVGVPFTTHAGASHPAMAGLLIIHSNSEFCGMVDTEGDGITLVNIGPGGCPA